MNKLLTEIKNSRDVRESTLKIYENNLNTLSKDINKKPFRSRQFLLKQKDAVIAKLQEYPQSKRRSMIASILVAISPKGKNQPQNKNFSKIYKMYNAMLKDENQVYQDAIADNQKSDKDIANWVNWKELTDKRDELGDELKCLGYTNYAKSIKGGKCDRQKMIHHLLLSLYTYLPPRRLEYANMILYPIGAYQQLGEEKDNNIYYVSNKGKSFIHYGKNSTKSKTDNNIIFNVPRALYDIIKRYIKLFEIKSGELLLENALGRKYTPNGLGKELKKLMKMHFNKEGSVGILRKSFLSNQFGGEIAKQNKLAEMMNHSKAVQQSVYVKV